MISTLRGEWWTANTATLGARGRGMSRPSSALLGRAAGGDPTDLPPSGIMGDAQIPCLYYCDLGRPKTREHVLQRGFGAARALKGEVCERSNTQMFSPLDGALVRFVHALAGVTGTRACARHAI